MDRLYILYGKDSVVKLIDKAIGTNVKFEHLSKPFT